jgi:hypothetical protein
MKIELRTREGGVVHVDEIPAFDPPPEVISWGTRIFVHGLAHRPDARTPTARPHVYVEGMLWPLVEIAVDARRI